MHPTRRQNFANTVQPHRTQDLTPRGIRENIQVPKRTRWGLALQHRGQRCSVGQVEPWDKVRGLLVMTKTKTKATTKTIKKALIELRRRRLSSFYQNSSYIRPLLKSWRKKICFKSAARWFFSVLGLLKPWTNNRSKSAVRWVFTVELPDEEEGFLLDEENIPRCNILRDMYLWNRFQMQIYVVRTPIKA